MDPSPQQQQQIEVPAPSGPGEPLIPFFAIGILINLALITAFALWAIRQWKQSGRRNPPDSKQ